MTTNPCQPSAFATDSRAIRFACPPQGDKNCFAGPGEPALRDLMEDPILRRLMASDGIAAEQLIEVIAEARQKLARA
jgi:hypothetical protein